MAVKLPKELIYIGAFVIGIVVTTLAGTWDKVVGDEVHAGSLQLLGMALGTIIAIAGIVLFVSEKKKT